MLHRLEQEENQAEVEYNQLLARLSDPTDRQIADGRWRVPGRRKLQRELLVPVEPGATTRALVYSATDDRVGATLMLAHGAGAGQRSPFMVDFAPALGAPGVDRSRSISSKPNNIGAFPIVDRCSKRVTARP